MHRDYTNRVSPEAEDPSVWEPKFIGEGEASRGSNDADADADGWLAPSCMSAEGTSCSTGIGLGTRVTGAGSESPGIGGSVLSPSVFVLTLRWSTSFGSGRLTGISGLV